MLIFFFLKDSRQAIYKHWPGTLPVVLRQWVHSPSTWYHLNPTALIYQICNPELMNYLSENADGSESYAISSFSLWVQPVQVSTYHCAIPKHFFQFKTMMSDAFVQVDRKSFCSLKYLLTRPVKSMPIKEQKLNLALISRGFKNVDKTRGKKNQCVTPSHPTE